eukprot:c27795_g1_i1 orf=183-353(+)
MHTPSFTLGCQKSSQVTTGDTRSADCANANMRKQRRKNRELFIRGNSLLMQSILFL